LKQYAADKSKERKITVPEKL